MVSHCNLDIWYIHEIVYNILEYANDFNLRCINTTCYSHFTRIPITVKVRSDDIYVYRILKLFEKYESVFVDFVCRGVYIIPIHVLDFDNICGFGAILNSKCISNEINGWSMHNHNFQKIKKIKLNIINCNTPSILNYFDNVDELELICNDENDIYFETYPSIKKLTITDCSESLCNIMESFPNVVEINETYYGDVEIFYNDHLKKYNLSVKGTLTCTGVQPEVLNIRTDIFYLYSDTNYTSFEKCKHISILSYTQTSIVNIYGNTKYYFDAPVLETLEIDDNNDIYFVCPPLEKLTIHCYNDDMSIICKMLIFYRPKKCYLITNEYTNILNIHVKILKNYGVIFIHKE